MPTFKPRSATVEAFYVLDPVHHTEFPDWFRRAVRPGTSLVAGLRRNVWVLRTEQEGAYAFLSSEAFHSLYESHVVVESAETLRLRLIQTLEASVERTAAEQGIDRADIVEHVRGILRSGARLPVEPQGPQVAATREQLVERALFLGHYLLKIYRTLHGGGVSRDLPEAEGAYQAALERLRMAGYEVEAALR